MHVSYMQLDDFMEHGRKVLLIMGSTRAGRICPRIAEWVARIGRDATGLDYEIVDLAQWPLPMDDEPGIPALGGYTQPHTRAWSDKIKGADGVIFVTPQFNWGYPAVLKNAVDHLYHEWHGKPAAIVSYGGHGGTRCAKQFRQVADAVKMRMVSASAPITLSDAIIREGAAFEPERDFAGSLPRIRKVVRKLAGLIEKA
jgi:NAD(P)H-dependent FMN reductase